MGNYDFNMNISNENDSHSIILRQIEKASTVLEFGCYTGIMTKYMKEQLHCNVYITEIDQRAFETASQYAVDGCCGDIEAGVWHTAFSDIKFDYIIFADVLEHLKSPEKTLQMALDLLKDDGEIIVSVPNIAYAGVMAELYLNQFKYRSVGILDETHLHMFSFESLKDMFLANHLDLVQVDATYYPLENTEFGYLLNQLPGSVLTMLQEKELSNVYQFILKGKKNTSGAALPQVATDNLIYQAPPVRTISATVSGATGAKTQERQFKIDHGNIQFTLNLSKTDKAVLIQMPASFGNVIANMQFSSDTRAHIDYRNIHGITVGEYDIFFSANSAIEVLLDGDAVLTISGFMSSLDDKLLHEIKQSAYKHRDEYEHALRCKEGHIEQLIESERNLQCTIEQLNKTTAMDKMCLDAVLSSHRHEIDTLERAYEIKLESQATVLTAEREKLETLIASKSKEFESLIAEKTQALAEKNDAYALALTEKDDACALALTEKDDACALALTEKDDACTLALTEKDGACALALTEKDNACALALTEKDDACALILAEKDNACTLALTEKEAHWTEVLAQQERQLTTELRNKEGHIELLLESDRELARIKSSRSWRMMGMVWHLRDICIPKGSKRRLLCKMMLKFVKHPLRFLRKATPSRIGKFFKTLKREGALATSNRLDDCLIGTSIPAQVLTITQASDVNAVAEKTVADYPTLHVPTWKKPQVSIVIPVYNQFDFTYHCVESILKQSGEATYEIIIGDDGSSDLTTELASVMPGVQVVRNPQNLRFLRNCNHAAQYAKGDYILFLNNDTQVQENWLMPLVSLMESSEKVGMVGSKLVYPDGRLQEAGGILWKDGSAWNYGNRSDPTAPEYNYVKEADYISGAAIMIRKTLWKEIGGFDEHFAPAYYEDTDLAFEVRKHGYLVMYQPLSVVVHFEGVSNGTDVSAGQKAYQEVNAKKFFEKWKTVLEADHFPNAENVYLAKDRSQLKKRVLVVDHYVPHHDKDAGGKCTHMYIKLFLALGMKVTFIGDNFFPHQPYTTELQQFGVEVLYGDHYYLNWKSWLKENAHQFDYFYLNRPHISIKYIDLIREYSKGKIIYFGHDLHYLREYRQYLIDNNPETLKQSQASKEREFNLFRKADVVYTVGSYEQEVLQKEFPEKPIRNIPVYIYDTVRPSAEINTAFETRKDLIFVGGFGHTPNIDAVEWFAEHVFPTILAKIPDIKWYIVGSKPPQSVLDLKSDNIIVTGFISDEALADLYDTCRLAVVPLRVGAGVKGKVVEANYCGIPLVTTPIGAEGLSLEEKAFVVCEPEPSMADTIVDIYQDYTKLKTLSKQSQVFIQNHFTLDLAKKIVQQDIDAGENNGEQDT